MFQYDKIAIGCNLSSAIYCFYNQIPMIFVEKRKVHPFEFFEPNTDLSLLKIEPLRYDLRRSDEEVPLFGASKIQVYEKMKAQLNKLNAQANLIRKQPNLTPKERKYLLKQVKDMQLILKRQITQSVIQGIPD